MTSRIETATPELPIPAVNYFITPHCNMRCRFCFAHFQEQRSLEWPAAGQVLHALAEAGMRKLTFVGGEPLLCCWLDRAIEQAAALGITTCVVTNGALVTADWCHRMAGALDWLGVSVDTTDVAANQLIGRTVGTAPLTVEHYASVAEAAHLAGMRLKINTVVSAWNWQHDLTSFIASARPDRWKVFQALPIRGQNDSYASDFTVTNQQFTSFRDRHINCPNVVFETNEAMRASYVMVSPDGRFFDNSSGAHRFSRPILDAGVG